MGMPAGDLPSGALSAPWFVIVIGVSSMSLYVKSQYASVEQAFSNASMVAPSQFYASNTTYAAS
jgi:hypothetical protein